ncbi:hypothetical protein pb186bvf_018936 [Paramecium bursaria]
MINFYKTKTDKCYKQDCCDTKQCLICNSLIELYKSFYFLGDADEQITTKKLNQYSNLRKLDC